MPSLSFTCRWVRGRASAQPRTSPSVAGSHQVIGSSTLPLNTVTARQRVADSGAPCAGRPRWAEQRLAACIDLAGPVPRDDVNCSLDLSHNSRPCAAGPERRKRCSVLCGMRGHGFRFRIRAFCRCQYYVCGRHLGAWRCLRPCGGSLCRGGGCHGSWTQQQHTCLSALPDG
jgi:hypothetical protein